MKDVDPIHPILIDPSDRDDGLLRSEAVATPPERSSMSIDQRSDEERSPLLDEERPYDQTQHPASEAGPVPSGGRADAGEERDPTDPAAGAVTARGVFEVVSGSEDTYASLADRSSLTHAWGDQHFDGDLVGQGTVHWLMGHRSDRSAAFVGLQRIDCTLAGRSGAIVLSAHGAYDGATSSGTWTIIEGLATGDLQDIAGVGSFTAGPGPTGKYVLAYTLRRRS